MFTGAKIGAAFGFDYVVPDFGAWLLARALRDKGAARLDSLRSVYKFSTGARPEAGLNCICSYLGMLQ